MTCPSASYLFVISSFSQLYLQLQHFRLKEFTVKHRRLRWKEWAEPPCPQPYGNLISYGDLQMTMIIALIRWKTSTLIYCLNANFNNWKLGDVCILSSHQVKKANSIKGLFELDRIEVNSLHLSSRAQHSTFLCYLDS